MQIKILLLMGCCLISSSILSQEIGKVTTGNHSVSLLKSNNSYICMYSDINSESAKTIDKSFYFPNKETIYNIIMYGFENKNNRQIFVQTNESTIIKFEYKRIKGQLLLRINHNNLENNVIGSSTYLTKKQIKKLFGREINFG
ncbi:MAG: hypothetical protein L3J14_08845 [Flavobacteriaceae bacterium]|nr:hypothetical protein [Flavobacteriaceae bacterium]